MKTILIVIVAVIFAILTMLWYVGMFAGVTVVEREEGGYVVAGVEHKGPYNTVGHVMTDVDNILRKMDIECDKGFGIYYNDPRQTPPEECLSYVGNVIEDVNEEMLQKIKDKGLRIDTINKVSSMVIEFPARTKLSYMIGPMKAYPALVKYQQEHSLNPSLTYELYDVPAKKTLFVMQYQN